MKKLTCLCCGSTDLEYYRETLSTEYRKINKDNKISKRASSFITDANFPWGIRCGGCLECFDYKTDSKGRIVRLEYK